MTEKDATTRFCPLARSLLTTRTEAGKVNAFAAVNQFKSAGQPNMQISTCLGSQCMLWRWTGKMEATGLETERRFGPIKIVRQVKVPGGRCGLAA